MTTTAALAWKQDQWQTGNASRFSRALVSPYRIASPEVSEPTTASEPDWFTPTLARFLDLAELGNDWDHRGSAGVRLDVLSFTLRSVLPEILPPTAPPPAVIPLGHGGIQLVWNTDDEEVELEVTAPNDVVAYHFDHATGIESEEPLTNDFSTLADKMWLMFAGR
jgi:hypothetical protein